jgi:hypothetical protein
MFLYFLIHYYLLASALELGMKKKQEQKAEVHAQKLGYGTPTLPSSGRKKHLFWGLLLLFNVLAFALPIFVDLFNIGDFSIFQDRLVYQWIDDPKIVLIMNTIFLFVLYVYFDVLELLYTKHLKTAKAENDRKQQAALY